MRGACRTSHRPKLYSPPQSSFTLCIELSLVADKTTRILCLPSSFLNPLPTKVGLTEKGEHYCFAWRTEFASEGTNLSGESHTEALKFGAGRIAFVDMNEFTKQRMEPSSSSSKKDEPAQKTNNNLAERKESTSFVPFIGGRSDITSGVIHLLRETGPKLTDDEPVEQVQVYRYASEDKSTLGVIYCFGDASVVLILAIPSDISPSQLVQFIGTEFCKTVEFIRLIRDAAPNRYMCILKFRDESAAKSFSNCRNGKRFNSSTPDLCAVVTIGRVEFATRAPIIEPLFDEEEFSEPAFESRSFVELPSCPVCLDRLDATVSGVLINMCSHKFHGHCISSWEDSSCPVCRFSMGSSRGKVCADCKSPEDLWLCLICGHAGCGRYRAGHASDHFLDTGHNFALELETHRVWDYAGDKYRMIALSLLTLNTSSYVHRLVQDKLEGKLVTIPTPGDPLAIVDEKLDQLDNSMKALSVDPEYYSSMLVAQMESQRLFYEEKMGKLCSTLTERIEKIGDSHAKESERLIDALAARKREIEELVASFERQRTTLEHRITELEWEKTSCAVELASEKSVLARFEQAGPFSNSVQMTKQAVATTGKYQELLQRRDQEIASLTEQVRDLMIHIDAQQKLMQAIQLPGELTTGTISVGKVKQGRRRKS